LSKPHERFADRSYRFQRNGHPIFQVTQKCRACESKNLPRIKKLVRSGAGRLQSLSTAMRRDGKIISFGDSEKPLARALAGDSM
jgi:hypothetical protein